ncbi:hypothetical protein RB195_000722 [Necator americanus]|uniref:Uncharacterized protein n=1 Tax=Necator americanus TaxID=51031 RepID=A0ABR1DCF1_NECAM
MVQATKIGLCLRCLKMAHGDGREVKCGNRGLGHKFLLCHNRSPKQPAKCPHRNCKDRRQPTSPTPKPATAHQRQRHQPTKIIASQPSRTSVTTATAIQYHLQRHQPAHQQCQLVITPPKPLVEKKEFKPLRIIKFLLCPTFSCTCVSCLSSMQFK